MKNKVDLTERHLNGGWAKYLPAISGFYTTHLGKDLHVEGFIPKERVPKGLEYGIQGLDFLKKEDSYYHYKWGLFSAGHAERRLNKCDEREPMIHKRDRNNTVIIGDSGGFQIAKGVIKLDWATVKTEAGDPLREEILRYLEYTADWSMTLDVPAFAADYPLSEKTGLTKFEDTLDVTEYNLHYFVKNRVPGATKFLNVLSGSTRENSKQWYDTVKAFSIPDAVEAWDYPRNHTLEGWAFAGINMRNMPTTLERILDLRDDDLLADKDWIHFLGIGRLDWACYLTSIERAIKKYYNPNINISFDAASPFVSAGGYALVYDYNYFTPNKLTYSMSKCVDEKHLKGSKMAMPFQGPIMERLTVGDICVLGPNDPNKQGKITNTSWDTTSYALIMAHNVYNHIHAVQEINRLADVEYAVRKIDYEDWLIARKTKDSLSEFVPSSILYFNSFVDALLDPANKDQCRSMLEKFRSCLDAISFGARNNQTYNNLFHVDADTRKDIDLDNLAGDYDHDGPENV